MKIREAVKGSTPEHVWFNPGSDEVALEAARDVGYATINPHEIHSYTEKQRPRLKPIPRISTTKSDNGESITEGIQFINDAETFYEPNYRSPNDQVLDLTATLQKLRPGEYLLKSPEHVSRAPIYCPMVEEPWPDRYFPGLADKKLLKAIERSQSRAEFTTPVVWEAEWATTTSSQNNGTKDETSGSTFTQVPPKTSSKPKSTRPPRKRGNGSKKANSEEI